MKKVFLVLLFLGQIAFSREIIAVSIPMQQEFVEKIAGNKYEVISLVKPGVNPHDFEPKFSDIKKLSNAVAYFGIGIEFEEVWMERFKEQNKKMKIYDNSAGIAKINFAHSHDTHKHDTHKHDTHKHDMHEHSTHEHAMHEHEEGDAHIWLSTRNAKQIANNIYQALKELDSTQDYTKTYEALIAEINQTHSQLKQILSSVPKHQKFVVFHPMLGYFAKDFDLEEISIEIEGKSPKMKEMTKVIETIKKNKLKIIFAQPEFSTKAAEFIAKESGAQLGFFSPLQTPWSENLLEFAKTLKKNTAAK